MKSGGRGEKRGASRAAANLLTWAAEVTRTDPPTHGSTLLRNRLRFRRFVKQDILRRLD